MNQEEIRLRPVREEDSLDLFNWRNDPETVKYSPSGEVKYEDHLQWFSKNINDPKTKILIITNQKEDKIGMVRFDLDDNLDAVISINLNPKWRGKGYGKLGLKKSLDYGFQELDLKKVRADLHQDNIPSKKIFLGIGFKETGLTEKKDYLITELHKNDYFNSKIKFGIKLWSTNHQWFAEAKERFVKQEFDFLELYVVPGTFDAEKLSILQEMPVNIHVPTEEEFNLLAEREKNLKVIEEARKFADFFHSEYIIVHPGRAQNLEIPENNWNLLQDHRIIIENVPIKPIGGGIPFQGYNYEQLQELLEKSGRGFCLDFSHAFKAAKSLQLNPKEFTKKLLLLKPTVFHVVSGHLEIEEDEHLNLWEGDFDLKWIKQTILKSKSRLVVFETPKRNNNLDNDCQNIKYFKELEC